MYIINWFYEVSKKNFSLADFFHVCNLGILSIGPHNLTIMTMSLFRKNKVFAFSEYCIERFELFSFG